MALLSCRFSTDEAATENILKAELTMASLCGRLGLVTPRDAFITAICKASLPPHYALTVLSSNATSLSSKGRVFMYCEILTTGLIAEKNCSTFWN